MYFGVSLPLEAPEENWGGWGLSSRSSVLSAYSRCPRGPVAHRHPAVTPPWVPAALCLQGASRSSEVSLVTEIHPMLFLQGGRNKDQPQSPHCCPLFPWPGCTLSPNLRSSAGSAMSSRSTLPKTALSPLLPLSLPSPSLPLPSDSRALMCWLAICSSRIEALWAEGLDLLYSQLYTAANNSAWYIAGVRYVFVENVSEWLDSHWTREILSNSKLGFPWWLGGKQSACQCRRHRFNPRSGKITHASRS